MGNQSQRDASKRYYTKVTAERREKGLCTTCGGVRDQPNLFRCSICCVLANERRKKKEESYLSKGKCKICSSPLDSSNRTMCPSCRKRYRGYDKKKHNKREELGKCTSCGGEKDDKDRKNCKECRAKYKELMKSKWSRCREQGLCVYCQDKAVILKRKRTSCLICWFKSIATSTLKDRNKWVILKELWEECNNKCAYTKDLLKPGPDASIDHKIPSSRGGNHNKENLQWVSFKINIMKRDLAHYEFIEFCHCIAKRFPTIADSIVTH